MLVESTKLFTQTAYAKHVGLSRVHVYRLIKAKKLKTVEVNGIILVLSE